MPRNPFYSKCQIVYDKKVRELCFQPYKNHKNGCPNFCNTPCCPPQAPLFPDIVDTSKPTYVIWNRFDFESHLKRQRENRPDASEAQLRCCLYWQKGARRDLERKIKKFRSGYPDVGVILRHNKSLMTSSPEATGVNVTKTMKNIGIELEWPPEKWAYQIAVAGSLR